MKQLILTVALALGALAASAQNYIVVNSEKIFKSIADYNTAISELDKLAEQYQTQVDEKFKEVETLYNAYQNQKAALSDATRQSFEEAILQREEEATKYQESLFGNDGELMKQRIAKIHPIQERVFAAIRAYAQRVDADLVLDSSNNPTLLYNSDRVECTEAIIALLQ